MGSSLETYNTTPQSKQTIDSLWRLMKIILDTLDFNEVVQKIADSVLLELGYLKLGYSIVVLALIDEKQEVLKRISISKTKKAQKALEITPIPFEEIIIPFSADENLCIRAIKEGKPFVTHDWKDILVPAYKEKDAREVQSVVGIKTSMVYPITYHGQSKGIIIFSMVKEESEVSDEERDLIKGYTDIVGLAVQNSLLYTELEKLSKKLRKVNTRLKALDEQKDEFISMAAHELRTPMTAIKGYLSMVVEGDAGELPDKAKGFLTDASAISERVIRLINNMLNVSRIEEGRLVYQMSIVNLARVAKEVYDSFKFEAERKSLEFTLESPQGIEDKVYVDPDRIHEVIANLVSNAIKYTKEGFVKVRLTQPRERKIRLEVIDSGPGISKVEQEKLFQKFYRVQSEAGKTMGTGLGLYISKLLIEKFSGEISLESDVGKGSNFWFELPIEG